MSQQSTKLSTFLLLLWFATSISTTDYFVDSHSNCTNNIYNNLNNPYVTYLGKFASVKQCINACLAFTNSSNTLSTNYCNSYTYFKSITNNHNNSETCWAMINNPIWSPAPINNLTDCGRIIYPCISDANCSFNGICNLNTGNCTCDIGWNGYQCGQLTLEPATKQSGYHMIDNQTNTSSWGGSVQYNKDTYKYVMFVAEMNGHCGINSWQRNSQIMYAEGTTINSSNCEYIRKSILLVPFAHSPDIIFAANTNQYVLLYVHNKTNNIKPPCNQCTNGATTNCNTTQNMIEITSIRYIDNLSNAHDINKWSEPIDIMSLGVGDSNFAATINNDGSLIGMMRKNEAEIYSVTASNWKDNKTYILHSKNLFPFLVKSGTEDMFIYKDCKGRYHSLFHNESPWNDKSSNIGAHG
eukprot:345621_1